MKTQSSNSQFLLRHGKSPSKITDISNGPIGFWTSKYAVIGLAVLLALGCSGLAISELTERQKACSSHEQLHFITVQAASHAVHRAQWNQVRHDGYALIALEKETTLMCNRLLAEAKLPPQDALCLNITGSRADVKLHLRENPVHSSESFLTAQLQEDSECVNYCQAPGWLVLVFPESDSRSRKLALPCYGRTHALIDHEPDMARLRHCTEPPQCADVSWSNIISLSETAGGNGRNFRTTVESRFCDMKKEHEPFQLSESCDRQHSRLQVPRVPHLPNSLCSTTSVQ